MRNGRHVRLFGSAPDRATTKWTSWSRRETVADKPGFGRQGCAGQSLVEFALVFPMLIILSFTIADLGRLLYTQSSVQDAIRQAGRFAVTGQHLPDPANPGQYLSRVQSIIQTAVAANPSINITNIQISSVGGGVGNAGGPGDTVTISLTTGLKLMTPVVGQLFPDGTYTFTVSVSFKNEPFSPGSTL